jgi:Cytochrome c
MRSMGMRTMGPTGGFAIVLALTGCNSFDDPNSDTSQTHLVIPTDERAALSAPSTPTPISGGTLTVLADGSTVLVADPERDRISVVDLRAFVLRGTIQLEPGDEPGRGVEDAQHLVHVALRRGGAVVAINPFSASLVSRRAVCASPRGLAFEAATGQLHVACAEGKLVSLPAAGGDITRTLTLDHDLRDVVVSAGQLWVTRFKSAELLRVSSAGTVERRSRLPQAFGQLARPGKDDTGNVLHDVTLVPSTAWRAVSNPTGGAVIVHQDAVQDEIEITEPSATGSAYGGGGAFGTGCDGIVRNAVSVVSTDGSVVSTSFVGAPLPVDVAASADSRWVAVAHAGSSDPLAPRPTVEFRGDGGVPSAGPAFFGGGLSVSVLDRTNLTGGCVFPQPVGVTDPVTAVTFTSSGALLAQTREPPQLVVIASLPGGAPQIIALPGESRLDTGHELFHRDAGGGIACASCHPEGGEDGRAWRFKGFGVRRTQPLHVGLRGTAPFHWVGDLDDIGELMSQVFVGRMGGVRESDARVSALSEWLFSIKPPAAIRPATEDAVARGRELFNSTQVGCATCHSGAKLTNNKSVAIDSGAELKLQVPSLVAVGYRAPFMHDGCAETLTARFDPACGGDKHGDVSGLSAEQREDLVAYLESL